MRLRITTWNVNGFRAAVRKGFADYLNHINPDVLLLQETRVLPEQLDAEWRQPEGWNVHWHSALRKGYSGTAVWSKIPFEVVSTGLSDQDEDNEGRLLHVRLSTATKPVEVASAYLPSGSSSEDRQVAKEVWMQQFAAWSQRLPAGTPVLLGGDLNIAHTEKDIFHAKSNQKTSGFLPHEREWFGELLESGWHDLIREHAGDVDGPYSWWSNRGRARELDRGWRIDYLLANASARALAVESHTHREAGLAVSDHAPVSVDIKLSK